MAPKRTKQKAPIDPNGIFAGMVVFLVENAVQPRRLQIWKQKLLQMGATIEDSLSNKVTHVFASSRDSVLQKLDMKQLGRFRGHILLYQWLQDSLASGEKVPEDLYEVRIDQEAKDSLSSSLVEPAERTSDDGKPVESRRPQSSIESVLEDVEGRNKVQRDDDSSHKSNQEKGSDSFPGRPDSVTGSPEILRSQNKDAGILESSPKYHPPDLNKTITDIFGKLINIYRALGDDRRSFSYYKAISVIEKLPFKIVSVDQVNNLPGIGKSMKDHIHEIITTGKLSKLEHFETDEKVKSISLFGEVWGIGPATAVKLYEKGHRTLDDLKKEESLTNSQKIGLKYFDDIKTRIPRNEVQEMEALLQKVGQEILPGVVIVCGGSYRRGKASCGDMDVIITHPDGKSHRGFLTKYVKRLKEMNLLREDLVFGTHSEEGTDSGVDTYFGLCTYPGRERRLRIDLKVRAKFSVAPKGMQSRITRISVATPTLHQVYPRDIYAFGLIAWTGNDVLNRRLRLLAESKGFRLDDTGLFPAIKRGERATASMKLDTEKEVFDFLGFPWLEPHERNL